MVVDIETQIPVRIRIAWVMQQAAGLSRRGWRQALAAGTGTADTAVAVEAVVAVAAVVAD